MSNQDEVIEGLAPNISDRGEINTIMKSHHQDFQMSNTLQKYNNDISEIISGKDTMSPNKHDNTKDYRT